jgi:hypothetical protein
MVTVPPLVAALMIGPALRPASRWGHLLPSAPLLDRPGRRLARPQGGVTVPAVLQWRHGEWRRSESRWGKSRRGESQRGESQRGESRSSLAARAAPGNGRDLAIPPRPTGARDVAAPATRASVATQASPPPAAPSVPTPAPHTEAMPRAVGGVAGLTLLWPGWRDRIRWRDAVELRSHGLLAPDGLRRSSAADIRPGVIAGLDTALRPAVVAAGVSRRTAPRPEASAPPASRRRLPSFQQASPAAVPPVSFRATPAAPGAMGATRTTVPAGGYPPGRVPSTRSGAAAREFAAGPRFRLPSPTPLDAVGLARHVTTEVTTRLTTVVQEEVARLAARPPADGPEAHQPAAPPLALPLDSRTATALLTQLRDLAREERFRYGLGR